MINSQPKKTKEDRAKEKPEEYRANGGFSAPPPAPEDLPF